MERVSERLAWPIAIVTGTFVAAGLILLGLTLDRPAVELWGFRGFPVIFAVETGVLGALIMSRRPGNVIGVLLAVAGLIASLQLFTSQYLVGSADGALPGSEWVAWVYAFIWVPAVAILIGYIPLLFPDGHLLSRRWRPLAWLIGLGAVGAALSIAVEPSVGGGGSTVPYPFQPLFDVNVVNVFWTLANGTMSLGIVAAFGSLWLRWRRSSGVEREQLKWLAWAGGLVVITLPLGSLPYLLTQTMFIFAVATVPLAVGIAVLRYRLYEIDTVISRTLVYGGLTAILAGLFAGIQRLLQSVFVTITGNESDAALVITTLVLATAFAPIKHALERLVARRFTAKVTPEASGIESAIVGSSTGGSGEDLESMLRRVVREELRAARPPAEDG